MLRLNPQQKEQDLQTTEPDSLEIQGFLLMRAELMK